MKGRREAQVAKLLINHSGDFDAQLRLCIHGRAMDEDMAEIFELVSLIWCAAIAKGLPQDKQASITIDCSDKEWKTIVRRYEAGVVKARKRLEEIESKAMADGDSATLGRIALAKEMFAKQARTGAVDPFRLQILLMLWESIQNDKPLPSLRDLMEAVNLLLPDAKDERQYTRALKELGVVPLPRAKKSRHINHG